MSSDYSGFFPAERRSRLPGGYMGKVLRVDLTSGESTALNLPEEPLLRKYWGGQLMAEYILIHELPPGVDPYDPRAVIVGMTGPITGTGFTPGGTKICFVYLSPATRYTLGRGATSGYFAVALKGAGYDGLILTGAASRPVYLYVGEDKIELRDASRLWGKGTRETEDAIRAEIGRLDARVGSIGPAGENLVRAAMLVNDYNHTAAHGLGAVMGSKKLKAIVAWGTRRPVPFDRSALIEAGLRWKKALAPRTTTVEKRLTSVGHGEDWGAITRLNWRSTVITDEARGLDRNHVVLRPCFQCPRMCPWDVEIGEGRHLGKIGRFNAGSEWMDTFYNLGFKGNDVLYLAERINDLGIECSHYACGAGLAFEAWEKGLLGPDRTDGLRLEWGDLEAAETLLERCARREGWLGNLLADGPKDLALALGGEALKWVVHTKGGTPAQHEWRPLLSQMLRELVASGGMKPQGAGGREPPPDLAYREKWGPLDPAKPDGWAISHLRTEQFRQACGMMGGCWFALNDKVPDGLRSMVDSLNATTGWDVDLDEMLEAGLRAIVLQSLFGTQRGWIAEHDWQDVGPRFLEPIPDGKYRGFTIARWLPQLIHEYYRCSGRHEKTGRPFMDTLQRLGLEEFEEWSHLD
ncbi:MAG TPA: aldehyde ferredoxin oxidoreductase N-terminal domain-containing protein [candidate division Zixibacteria bacterium]|nr:aldehyde ferredoxin oxidoreductase N-terminal domain-containing protein [candidate division Zixibacteria bacterium]